MYVFLTPPPPTPWAWQYSTYSNYNVKLVNRVGSTTELRKIYNPEAFLSPFKVIACILVEFVLCKDFYMLLLDKSDNMSHMLQPEAGQDASLLENWRCDESLLGSVGI
jgi:hypothetical protein